MNAYRCEVLFEPYGTDTGQFEEFVLPVPQSPSLEGVFNRFGQAVEWLWPKLSCRVQD